jgi:signal transduction histidine kinase/ligand-binding sensor domain-containing protein
MKLAILRHLFILIISLYACTGLHAQDPFREFKMTHWDSKKGMPNDLVLSIFQTSDGFVWLSGYFGLARFDGAEFAHFNSKSEPLFTSDGFVSVLAESSDTALWIATPGSGLLRYKQGKFQAFLTDKANLFILGVVNKDDLLVTVGNSSQEFIVFNARTRKSLMVPPKERGAWFAKRLLANTRPSASNNIASGRLGLPKVLNRNGVLDTLNAGDNGTLDGLAYSSIFTDSKGRIWMGSDQGLFTLEQDKLKPFPGMEGQSLAPISPTRGLIVEDGRKGIWVGTKDGLAYLPDGAKAFSFYTNQGQTGIRNVSCMMTDAEGNIWAGTDKGIFKFSRSKVINFSEKDGIVNSRMAGVLEIGRDDYLIATRDNKAYTIRNNKVAPYLFKNPNLLSDNFEILHLYKDAQENIWIGGNKVVVKINNREEKRYKVETQARMVTTGIDGRIYFAIINRGIAYINEHDTLSYLNLGVDLSSYFLSSLRQLADGTWILTSYNEGIVIVTPGKKPIYYKQVDTVSGVPVFNSYQDKDGTLWFPTANGIARLADGKLQLVGTKDGMPDGSAFEILEDQSGNFWIPGNYGVLKVKKSDLIKRLADSSYTITWTMLDEADGLNNRQTVGARHSILSSDGKVLVVGVGGLIMIDPSKIQANAQKPLLAINQLSVDDQAVDMTAPVFVGPGDHRYVFSYSALSFTAPEKVMIKFRMRGYDRDWIVSKGERRAIYTNLPPGEHVFEIIAANSDGVWTEVPRQFAFTVKPFFYQTIWFRVLALLGLLGLIWGIVRWRTASVRERTIQLEKEVGKRTEELHKQKMELEQTLGSLKSTQAQLIQAEKMASLGELTAGIAHEIQNPLNFVNNFSEVSVDLISEMKDEFKKGSPEEGLAIADDIKQNLDKILHHGKRADAIVKGMLQHSRSSTGTKEPTDINALCDEYLRLSYHGLRAKDKSFNAQFHFDPDPSIGMINVVPQDMGRVLLNLINNAFYAVNEKKKKLGDGYEPMVTVSTKLVGNSKNPPIEPNQPISQLANGPIVLVSVRDNGLGIPETHRNKIFQPFFTTKPTGEGTGLGLSLSYDIIKAHGGELRVETMDGEGSKFIIQLPITVS